MLMGTVFAAYPNKKQKLTLSQWIGCSNFIYRAKCDEEYYLTRFAKRYLPIGVFPKIDQTFAQYKNPELSPWLSDCPSQILRNSAVNWFKTYKNFLKGNCGKPRHKRKTAGGSIHLTRELFCFEKCEDGVLRLFIGSKKNNIGYLSIKKHKSFKEPKSIRIKKQEGKYFVAFCYEDGLDEADLLSVSDHLEHLKACSREDLLSMTVGIDRGVVRPVQAGGTCFDFSKEQKHIKKAKEKYIRRLQKKVSKQTKGSTRRNRQKNKLSKAFKKISNIRKDFCHKTSRSIIDEKKTKVIILEDLKVKQMTKSPKAKKDEKTGKWKNNRRKSKAGLNRSILDRGWHLFEKFITYKA